MRSLADSSGTSSPGARRTLEMALRLAALVLVAIALWLELRPERAAHQAVERAGGDGVAEALARWTADPEAEHVHAALDGVPADTVRDWLRALRGAGSVVSWSAPELHALALAVEPRADPTAPVRLLAAAPAGSEVAFADGAGSLGQSEARGGGASVVVGAVAGVARATVGGVAAYAAVPAPLELRPVLVIGQAGWESGFVTSALEERGWRVVARLAVAPGVQVTQGTVRAIDTASFSAVVALDSTASSQASAIARYVRSGGGLVLGTEAAAIPALASLAPGRLAAAERADASLLASGEPRRGLPLHPVTARGDAIALERRGPSIAVAARRVGAGRVVLLGYEETWRWRMAGAEGAPEAHRAWWSGLVAAAAYAPRREPSDTLRPPPGRALDDAPVARLIAALGPPVVDVQDVTSAGSPGERGAPPWIFPLVAVLLLAEWALRRLRGAR